MLGKIKSTPRGVSVILEPDKGKNMILLILLILYIIYLVHLVKKYGKLNEYIYYSINKRASELEKAIFGFSTGLWICFILLHFFRKGDLKVNLAVPEYP